MKLYTLIILLMSLTGLSAQVLFSETFNTTSIPAGWHIAGSVGIGHSDPGTPKTTASLFPSESGYNFLRLTENQTWHRAWAYNTQNKFRVMGQWRLDMEFRSGKSNDGTETSLGGDGTTFIFADASTVETGGIFDPAKVVGGYGQYQGAPRAGGPNVPVNNAQGYHPNFRGFSFEFDHYNNGEPSTEYVHWVELKDWDHSGLGKSLVDDTSFYYNDGWVRAQLEGNNGVITLRYGWNGSIFVNSHIMNANSPLNPNCDPIYDYYAYLGIGAATGGQTAFHDIRYISLEVIEETLPVSLSSFNGVGLGSNQIRLQWITQTETNVLGYRIYRSETARFDDALLLNTFISASNSSQAQVYTYIDADLYRDGTYYYWLQNLDIDGQSGFHGPVRVQISGQQPDPTPPVQVTNGINRIYPNPFNPETTISYGLEKPEQVDIRIYNIRGQLVRRLFSGIQASGNHRLVWDGRDDSGQAGTSGAYILVLTAGSNSYSRRMILSK